jgi:hypothetical protein
MAVLNQNGKSSKTCMLIRNFLRSKALLDKWDKER